MKYIVEKDSVKSVIDVVGNFALEEQMAALGFTVLGLESELTEIKEAMDLAKAKEASIKAAYDVMNAEVLAEMTEVFGTSNPDSASAYERTWNMMAQTPADWSGAGLKASFAVASMAIGDALDTNQKVQDYANAKVAEVKAYGIWRMQRIETFRQVKETILNG